jgi:hypothetical protein
MLISGMGVLGGDRRVRAPERPLSYSRSMAASLSTAERRILEAAEEVRATGTAVPDLTVVIRRTLGQLPGPEFRRVWRASRNGDCSGPACPPRRTGRSVAS